MNIFGVLLSIFSCTEKRSTFKPTVLTKRGYYVDGNAAYFYGGFGNASVVELKDVNVGKFEVYDKRFPAIEGAGEYAGDDQFVYYLGNIIEDADPLTFEIIGFGLAKDSNVVFSYQSILSRDPDNFVQIEGGLFKDSKYAYHGDRIVSHDPDHLVYLGKFGHIHYYKDSKGIIANDLRIDSIDILSFKPMDHNYLKDISKVYLIEDGKVQHIGNSDAETFRVIAKYYAADKSRVFWRGLPLPGANPGKFKIISEEHHCSCDDQQVYHHNKIISGASPTSFPIGKKFKYCNDKEIVFE